MIPLEITERKVDQLVDVVKELCESRRQLGRREVIQAITDFGLEAMEHPEWDKETTVFELARRVRECLDGVR